MHVMPPYTNTRDGVRRFLAYVSDMPDALAIPDDKIVQDPVVDGVWAVRGAYDAIVYLNRPVADFEECEFSTWPPQSNYP